MGIVDNLSRPYVDLKGKENKNWLGGLSIQLSTQ
jgi:hypothetical protein